LNIGIAEVTCIQARETATARKERIAKVFVVYRKESLRGKGLMCRVVMNATKYAGGGMMKEGNQRASVHFIYL
jgi:hypothetical protein